ncbi:MAG: hypothetical protein AAF197_12935, partial [Pseudomonadota bacterium]
MFQRIATSAWFEYTIIGLILFTAVIIGIEGSCRGCRRQRTSEATREYVDAGLPMRKAARMSSCKSTTG